MNKRGILVVVGLWLGTVAVASALTWSVISLAGARVGQPSAITLPIGSASATATASSPGTVASPVAQTDSWTGAAGKLTARCRGDRISLVAATPAVGFSVEIRDRGPEQLRLEFEGRESEQETSLRATCVDGRPEFAKE